MKVIKDNNIKVHRLWLDVEPTTADCKAWNLSKEDNLALAKQWVAAIKATGLKWGIYANALVLPRVADNPITYDDI